MKQWIALIRTSLKVYFGFSVWRYQFKNDKKKLLELAAIALAVVVGVAPIIYGYIKLIIGFYDLGAALGQPEFILMLAVLVSLLITLIFGFISLLSGFYFSNDLSVLVPLPLTPIQVLASKFVQVLATEYLSITFLYWPAVITYGIKAGPSFLYWLASLAVFVLLPMLPLLIAAIFVIPLMRFRKANSDVERWTAVISIIMLVVILGAQFAFQRMVIAQGADANIEEALFQTSLGLSKSVSRYFPPSLWAMMALHKAGTLVGCGYFLLYALLAAGLGAAMFWIAKKMFYRGLLSGKETRASKRLVGQEQLTKEVGLRRTPLTAVFIRDWKLFWRTSIWVVNSMVGALIMPVILALTFLMMPQEQALPDFAELLEKANLWGIMPLIIVGVTMLFGSMFGLASYAISREGPLIWISKVIPVAPAIQVRAKLRHALVMIIIAMIPTWIVAGVMLKIPLLYFLPGVVLSIPGLRGILAAGLLVDLLRPYLTWDNPTKAVKQNLNVVFAMFVAFWVIGIGAFLAVKMITAGLALWQVYLGVIVYLLLLMVGLEMILRKTAAQRYAAIEV